MLNKLPPGVCWRGGGGGGASWFSKQQAVEFPQVLPSDNKLHKNVGFSTNCIHYNSEIWGLENFQLLYTVNILGLGVLTSLPPSPSSPLPFSLPLPPSLIGGLSSADSACSWGQVRHLPASLAMSEGFLRSQHDYF